MSTPTIELVWVASGRPLTEARHGLRAALARADILVAWDEWKGNDVLMPPQFRSDDVNPRLYVNGRLAWTSERDWNDEIALAQAVLDLSAATPIRRTADPLARRVRYVLLPSAGLALLPKCPLCWMAYAGVTASFGLTPLAARQTALVAFAIAIIGSALAVAARAIQIGDRAVLWPLAAGVILVIAGTSGSLPSVVTYLGLFAILFAAIWSAWPRASIPRAMQLRAR